MEHLQEGVSGYEDPVAEMPHQGAHILLRVPEVHLLEYLLHILPADLLLAVSIQDPE